MVHQSLLLEPVRDQLRHGDERQAVHGGELQQLIAPHRGAVFGEYLADDARGRQPGETRKVHGGLSVADALQLAAIARAQREDVSRTAQLRRHRGRIDRDLDRLGAIVRADPGRHAEPRRRVDAHGERGPVLVRVIAAHLGQRQLVGAIAGDGNADQAAGAFDHEVHGLGRDQLRRADEIAFVLAILIVRYDDHPAVAYVLYSLLDRAKAHAA